MFLKEIIAGYWNRHVLCDNMECFYEQSAFVADFSHIIYYLFSKQNNMLYQFTLSVWKVYIYTFTSSQRKWTKVFKYGETR